MAEEMDILGKDGSSEFEIVEFRLGDTYFGINVVKVREIIQSANFSVTPIAQSHPYVDGIFTLRGHSMPIVNLARCLDVEDYGGQKNIIVTSINNYFMGFLVDQASRIYRVAWKDIEPAPTTIGMQNRVTGVIQLTDKLLLLIDFETIMAEVNPIINKKLTSVKSSEDSLRTKRSQKPLVLAEDSLMLRNLLASTLKGAGYTNIRTFANGQEAWNYIHGLAEEKTLKDRLALVVSDIEMPQMDGHHLLKLIRDDPALTAIPVVFFSSLINDAMRRAGEKLGVNGQIAKPEINNLVSLLDQLLFHIKPPESD